MARRIAAVHRMVASPSSTCASITLPARSGSGVRDRKRDSQRKAMRSESSPVEDRTAFSKKAQSSTALRCSTSWRGTRTDEFSPSGQWTVMKRKEKFDRLRSVPRTTVRESSSSRQRTAAHRGSGQTNVNSAIPPLRTRPAIVAANTGRVRGGRGPGPAGTNLFLGALPRGVDRGEPGQPARSHKQHLPRDSLRPGHTPLPPSGGRRRRVPPVKSGLGNHFEDGPAGALNLGQ